jgi:hypothetical protein
MSNQNKTSIARAYRGQNDTPEARRRRNNDAKSYRERQKSPEVRLKTLEYYREYRKKNHEQVLEYARSFRRNNVHCCLYSSAKERAVKIGVPFDLTSDYIKSIWPENNCCPILNTPFTRSKNHESKENSATIDRFQSSLGYVKGNVAIISGRANRLKDNSTLEELEAVLHYVRSSRVTVP